MSDLSQTFHWGHVVKEYDIGPYTIREFHPRVREGNRVLAAIDPTKTEFYGYIDGKDTHESWPKLEDAMAGLIVRRFIGANNSAISQHFMLGLRGAKAIDDKHIEETA